MSQSRIGKLTVALQTSEIEDIADLASEQGATKTRVLREAIALKVFVEHELSVPGTRLLLQRGSEVREVVFSAST